MKFKLTAVWRCTRTDYNRELLEVIGSQGFFDLVKEKLIIFCQHCEEPKALRDIEDLQVTTEDYMTEPHGIVSAYRDTEGWVLSGADGEPVNWPSDWPDMIDSDFLRQRGITVAEG